MKIKTKNFKKERKIKEDVILNMRKFEEWLGFVKGEK